MILRNEKQNKRLEAKQKKRESKQKVRNLALHWLEDTLTYAHVQDL